jgi:hypothetical protein
MSERWAEEFLSNQLVYPVGGARESKNRTMVRFLESDPGGIRTLNQLIKSFRLCL